MIIQENKSLKDYNTCKIDVKSKFFIELNNENEIIDLVKNIDSIIKPIYFLGLGANTLFTNDYNGTIIHQKTKGIEILYQDKTQVLIKAKAGELWDDFVSFCIKNNYYGCENLVAIPSSIGAVPIQNIGAYGAEAKDIIHKVIYYELESGKKIEIDNKSCNFSYRNSIFKQELKDRFIITEVVFKVRKNAELKIDYKQIIEELRNRKISNPTISELSSIIRQIRESKLPDYKVLGNAGSFFKNPIVSINQFKELEKEFPNIIYYKINKNSIKIAAAWLIDNANLKGFSIGGAAVHKDQALVLINKDNANGQDFNELSKHIQKVILEKYNIQLEPEVIII